MPDRPRRYAVIPTYNRPDVLLRALAPAVAEADTVFVIDNGDDPDKMAPVSDADPGDWLVLRVPMRPPNLSKLWNIGLHLAARDAYSRRAEEWDVAVLNDDAIIPPGWFDAVASQMRRWGAAAGSSGLASHTNSYVHRTPGTTALSQRMQGHAFILRGETGLRADERLWWWCGDNDLDMQARQAGGTVIIGGYPVEHLYPDQSTVGDLAVQTSVDMQTFVDKWGWRPW
jgi:glycosyltransferase involved in cell wall biosynthesis